MQEILANIDWNQFLKTLWTVVLLPIFTYAGNEFRKWLKKKQIDKYTDILEKKIEVAVKDIYETIVKDAKGNPDMWTDEMKQKVHELAKTKAIQALSNSAYKCLKESNEDLDEYMDTLIGAALFDLKNQISRS